MSRTLIFLGLILVAVGLLWRWIGATSGKYLWALMIHNMLYFALIVSLVLIVLYALAIFYSIRTNKHELFSSLFDQLGRVVIFGGGILFGLATFLAQKEVDRIDKDIDSIRESISNIEAFRGKYFSDIEEAYLLNISEFDHLQNKCSYLDKKDKNYCSGSGTDAGPLKISDISEALELFEDPYIEKPNFDVPHLIEQDVFLKRHIAYNVLVKILRNNTELNETFGILQDDWTSLKTLAAKNKKLTKYNVDQLINNVSDIHVKNLGRDLCCTVIEMRDNSKRLSEMATVQAKLFCDIKSNLFTYLQTADQSPAESALFHVLFYNRVSDLYKDLRKAIDNQERDPNSCVWNPAKMCPMGENCPEGKE